MTMSDLQLLRLYINDPHGADEALTQAQLQDIIDASATIHHAAAECWRIKAATVADWYQANVDGTFVSRNQVFDHCMAMAAVYDGQAGNEFSFDLITTATTEAAADDSAPEF